MVDGRDPQRTKCKRAPAHEWMVRRVPFGLRELRSGVRGFRVLIACLALGVAAVAGVGSSGCRIERGT